MTATNLDKPEDTGSGWIESRRILVWALGALVLLLPLVAMQFTSEVNWTVSDFLFAGVLVFGSLGTYELAVRRTNNTAYRAGVGVAIVAAFLLTWINMAVGITDSVADLGYLGVPVVGLVGAVLVKFRPEGMARALLATACAQAVVGGSALIAGIVPPHNSAVEILGLTGLFVGLFMGSAWLFWQSARDGTGQA